MSENLYVGSHITSNDKYRNGWDRTFGNNEMGDCETCQFGSYSVFEEPCNSCRILPSDSEEHPNFSNFKKMERVSHGSNL